MKGLLKNDFLSVYANAKVFSVFLALFGVFVVAVASESLLIGYGLVAMVGFSVNAIGVSKNQAASQWGKYKLTLPVRRADIVKSLFINQALWLLAGTLFAGTGLGLSWLLHGCPFYQAIDSLSLFSLGISMSLFMGAIFFPLFYFWGDERSEVSLVLSFLGAFALDWALISAINHLLGTGTYAILAGLAILLSCSLGAFCLSCPLTVGIFRRKEY